MMIPLPFPLAEKATHKLRGLQNQPAIEDTRAQLKGELAIHVKERVKLVKQLTVRAFWVIRCPQNG